MRKGMLKRFVAVFLSAAMVLGLMPGAMRTAKAADVYKETQPGVRVRISMAELYNVDMEDPDHYYTGGETRPTSGYNYGRIYYNGSSIEISYDQFSNICSNSDFDEFVADAPGVYTFEAVLWDEMNPDPNFEQRRTIQITVASLNNAPTDISLSSSSIKASSTGAGAAVGTLGTTDADGSDSHTYTLVSGTGSTNNSDFQISGTSLQTSKALAVGNYSIRVRSTDSSNAYFEKAFAIAVYTTPTLVLDEAASISTTGAVLSGTVNPANISTAVKFTYGLTSAYGSTVTAAQSPVSGMADTTVSYTLNGLVPNTLYHFGAFADYGATNVVSEDKTFITLKAAPTAATNAANGISGSSATLNGTVNANNDTTTVTFEYGLTSSYGSTASATPGTATGTSNTSVSCSLSGLTPNTTYHYRVAAVNGGGTALGSDATFTTTAIAPSVSTGSASSVTSSGALLNGTVNANNTGTSVAFEYGLDTSYGLSDTADESPVAGTANSPVSKAITGLLPNTQYHFRIKGTNAAGTTNGSDATFTTGKAAPLATTNAAGSISGTSATLNGTVNASNEETAVTFEYGLSTAYGTQMSADQSPVSGTTSTAVSYALTGLTPNTPYHYRVVAENPTGKTYGADQTFNTSSIPPSVTTGTANGIAASAATLNAAVNANNTDTTVTFDYGLTTDYGTAVSAVPGTATGTGSTNVSAALTGLQPNTLYHFRVVGINTAGTSNGSDASFTTGKAAPLAITNAAGGVSGTSATLNGAVNASNEETAVTFEYGLTNAYGVSVIADESPVSGAASTSVSHTLSGLVPNTTYHYRVVAENPTGTTYGSDQTFDTAAIPPAMTTGSANSITTSGATLSATVNPNNAQTSAVFEYGLTTAYGSTVHIPGTANGTSAVGISISISGLKPNTQYHFRFVGTNVGGIGNGADATFTTEKAAPEAATNSASAIMPDGASLHGTVNASNESTTVTFEYGLTDAYGTTVTADQSPVTGTSDTSVSHDISGLTPNTTYHYRVAATNPTGTAYGLDSTFTTPLKPNIVLTPDTTNNSVDHPLEITFTPDADFEACISRISFGGADLRSGTDFSISSGKITLYPAGGNAVLQTRGTGSLLVAADGYNDSSVTQQVTAGAASSLVISTQPSPGAASGDMFASQPVVTLKDQYGNICADGESASADVTAGISFSAGDVPWNIVGTLIIHAVNGVATFSDLQCQLVIPGKGRIEFSASPTVTALSNQFTIPSIAAPVLVPDTTDNTVDNPLEITMLISDSMYLANIISVTANSELLTEGQDYAVYPGGIILTPVTGRALLHQPGTLNLAVESAGYNTAIISQTITAGLAETMEIITEPVPGENNGDLFSVQPVIILKDQFGNICTDGPSAFATVEAVPNSAAAGMGAWTIDGTTSVNAVDGIVSFADLRCTLVLPGKGKVVFHPSTGMGLAPSAESLEFIIPLKKAIKLTADNTDNSVDYPFEITFPANADFEGNVSGITVNGMTLTPWTDYEVTSGKIILKPAGGNAALRMPGLANVIITAAGYRTSVVTQPITAGIAASLAVTRQPKPDSADGKAFATQPVVSLYDQYGNVCADGPSKASVVTASALAGTGAWSMGGAASKAAVNGVVTYDGLTSTISSIGTGKILFSLGVLTVESSPFSIPERNSGISPAAARFDKYSEGSNYKDITVSMSLNGNTLDTVKNGAAILVSGTDYSVSGSTLMIKKGYLVKLSIGTKQLTFDFSQGINSVLTVTIVDSTPQVTGPQETPPQTTVIVNGEAQDAGRVSTTEEGGITTTTVTVDNSRLQQIIDTEGKDASVIIPVMTGSSVASVNMNGQMMSNLQSTGASLQVQTQTSTYTLPSGGLDMDAIAQQLGENVSKKDVTVTITISEPPAQTVQVVESAAEEGNFSIVLPAVQFNVECSHGGQKVEVSSFNAFVERTIAIPDGVDPYKITTAIVVKPDGTTYSVPTQIIIKDDKYYAVINSLTNSVYTVIWHPVEFPDMKDHWAKEAVNNMGSRMVVTGIDEKNYGPDVKISRADFVADVVRALGLDQGQGINPYSDVKDTDWYEGYVKTAVTYGLLNGDGAAAFDASAAVTREEALVMIAKAMEIAGMDITISLEEVERLLQDYQDGQSVPEVQKALIAVCLKEKVYFETKDGSLLLGQAVTRAEAAVILEQMLIHAELI